MKLTNSRPKSTREGFTLIELLTVVSIIIILAGMSLGAFSWANRKSTKTKTEAQLRLLENGIQQYYADIGSYPRATGRGSKSNGGNDSMLIYAMCFGDVGDDGAVVAGRRGPTLQYRPNENATVYIDELDPNIPGNPWFDKTPKPTKLIDPYGRGWYYRSGTNDTLNPDFDLWSDGADSSKNDDITNW